MIGLRTALEEYLDIHRALGFKLCSSGSLLGKFVLFVEGQGSEFITVNLALRWATQPEEALSSTWSARLGMVRGFARYLGAADPRTEVPPQGLLPRRYQRKAPYIYSDDEIEQLVDAAGQLPTGIGLRPCTYSTLFGLIAATGMRMSEPVRLDCEDVDFAAGVLTIRQTKFGKYRLIPVHPSTQRVLQQYANKRDGIFPYPKTPSFFVSDRGALLTDGTVRWTFAKVSCRIGLRTPGKRHGHGPRLHDLRHRYAVRTILNCYREGKNVEREMPKLAAYLGHAHVNDTYWYLESIPELMRLAAVRIDHPQGGPLS